MTDTHRDHDHPHDHDHEEDVAAPADDFSRVNPRAKIAAFHADGAGVARIGYPIRVTRGQILRRTEITPSMLRLTIGGPEFAEFQTYQCDDHVKVVLALPDGTRSDPVMNAENELDWPRPAGPARKYTVRRFDPVACEIDLDVVVHEGGLASTWAAHAPIGEEVVIAGPPGAKAFAHNYDHYVFAIDPTGLPSLARWLDEAPAEVSADVLIDVDHAHEREYPLAARDGVRVQWLDRTGGSRLADEVARLELPATGCFLFAAGEATDLKPLRRWASARGIDALVTGYWKRGVANLDE